GTNPLPVGEPIIETTLGSSATGGGSTTFSFYLNRRSFIAVGACVSPPRVFSGGAFSWIEPSSDPVFEVFTFLAPVEAS
ncbi:MAG: hypothetical protein KDD70_08315, partial [Bdellovibrionales bacterium]|nr:hypothetical protein [Bdellovibrionales bacterium]